MFQEDESLALRYCNGIFCSVIILKVIILLFYTLFYSILFYSILFYSSLQVTLIFNAKKKLFNAKKKQPVIVTFESNFYLILTI